MRRQDIQLLAAARSGNTQARCEAGRRYLIGDHGFPRHLATGIEYLTHASVRDSALAQGILADTLSVQELMAAELVHAAEGAARHGNAVAQVKVAACLLTSPRSWSNGLAWLDKARLSSHPAAALAWSAARREGEATQAAVTAFQTLARTGVLDAVATVHLVLQRARVNADLDTLSWCLQLAEPWVPSRPQELAEFVVEAIALAEQRGHAFTALPPAVVEPALEHRQELADLPATYQLGRALAGLPCAGIPPDALVTRGSLRKAAALLLRAADGGLSDAWMHLYRLSSNHRCTVANPQMARFFLEKAASSGSAEAQRRLGALLLRQSGDTASRELAMHWLHQAHAGGDALAKTLMDSMVLPVVGSDDEAETALRVVQRADPRLAARLSVARKFGLTRLEALALNPARGMRPWGLVVSPATTTRKTRLTVARAIPALSHSAMASLRAAANLFARDDAVALAIDGDVRPQARTVRVLFARHGIDESLFFAHVRPRTLEALRRGARWTSGADQLVKAALQGPA